MKLTFFTLFALFLTVLALGGLISAIEGRSDILDLAITVGLAWAAWSNWKYVAELRGPRAARLDEPNERPWKQRR